MTVAFDVGPLKPRPAGVGTYVGSLARGLAEIGRSDLVYVGLRGDASGLPDNVPAIRRTASLPYPVWVEMFGDRDVRKSKAAISHFTDGLVPPFRFVPTIVTVLDLTLVADWRSHRIARYPRIPFVLAAPRLASRVIAISQATADDVMKRTGTPAAKIDVIPLAPRQSAGEISETEVERATDIHGIARGMYFLVSATIEPRKNHIRTLAAFERLAADGSIPSEMVLVLAGQVGWRAQATLDAIEASPVRSRVKVLGYVSDDDLSGLMAGSAAVLLVSTSEGFGLPVLEGLACGAPVVTSNVSSMPEVAGDAAILVDPFDIDAIARGMLEALGADEQSRERGRQHAAGFTWASTASATAAVYDRLAR